MSHKLLLNEEKRREMRRNILLHRRKVVSFLENAYNVNLKPIVQSHPFELLDLDMFVKNKVQNSSLLRTKMEKEEKEYRVKQEIIETDSFNDCKSDVSVRSSQSGNGICQTPNFENDKNSNMRSLRLIMDGNFKGYRKYYKQSESDYSDDSGVSNSKKKQSKNPEQREKNRLRLKDPQIRKKHNARIRLWRSFVGKLFVELSKCCSYLDTKRRVPSKCNILVAAKRECDSLKLYEKKLIFEKEYWNTSNEQLKGRLKAAGSVPSDVILIDD